jgi:hypothetical protein
LLLAFRLLLLALRLGHPGHLGRLLPPLRLHLNGSLAQRVRHFLGLR